MLILRKENTYLHCIGHFHFILTLVILVLNDQHLKEIDQRPYTLF